MTETKKPAKIYLFTVVCKIGWNTLKNDVNGDHDISPTNVQNVLSFKAHPL